MEHKRETFEQILERKKKEGHHRVLESGELLVDPVRFKENMRQVHEDYVRMSNASVARSWNIIVF